MMETLLAGRKGPTVAGLEQSFSSPCAKTPLLFYLTLLLLVLVVYGGSLGNRFAYDDGLVIANNLFIRDFSHVKDLFTPTYFQASGELSYRPWVTFSYFMDYAVFGLARWGYRLHSILLHLGVAIALVWLLGCLGVRGWPAWLAVLVFAVHPVAVESVVSPANREELYCALFLMLSLGLLIKKKSLFPVCLLFAFALLSKETAAVLPLLFLGTWIFARRSSNFVGISSTAAALFATLSLYCIVRFVLLCNPLELALQYRGGSLGASVWAHARGWTRMLKLFIAPTDLNVDFGFTNTVPWSFVGTLGAMASFVLASTLLIGAWLVSKRSSVMALGLLWIFCAFLPVAGFVPIANVFAERFLYVPLLGFAVFLAGLGDLLRKDLGRASIIASCLCILCLGVMSQERTQIWKDGETLWADAVAKNPHRARARNNLGAMFLEKGMVESAGREFGAALNLDPRLGNAWANLADYHEAKRDYAKAKECYQTALMISDTDPAIHLAYGDVLFKMKMFKQAESQYREALRLRPHYAEVLNNFGILLLETGRMQEAKEKLQKALAEVAAYPDALCNLGTLLARSGDVEGGISLWKKALKIYPYHQGAQENIKAAYLSTHLCPH